MLSLLTWVAFGAIAVGQALGRLSWQAVAYAVLSLTVIRMAPVYLALAGANLTPGDKLFVGWFGPRGLASIVFAVIVIDADLPGRDDTDGHRRLHRDPEHPGPRAQRQPAGCTVPRPAGRALAIAGSVGRRPCPTRTGSMRRARPVLSSVST